MHFIPIKNLDHCKITMLNCPNQKNVTVTSGNVDDTVC